MPRGTKVDTAERALKAGAKKKGLSGRRADAYTFGTLNNIGLKRGNKTTARGAMKSKTVSSAAKKGGRKTAARKGKRSTST